MKAAIQMDQYIAELFGGDDLGFVEENILAAGMPQISVSPTDGRFLAFLAHLTGARRVLEIGTLGGYSTIWLARAGAGVTTIELSPDYAEVARRNIAKAGVAERVEIKVGPALEVLPQLEGPYDLVFIDADKPSYAEYLDWSVKLSRPGTLIVADNVVREGEVANPQTEDAMALGIRRFNDALARSPNLYSTILQTVGLKGHDGMALALVQPPQS